MVRVRWCYQETRNQKIWSCKRKNQRSEQQDEGNDDKRGQSHLNTNHRNERAATLKVWVHRKKASTQRTSHNQTGWKNEQDLWHPATNC